MYENLSDLELESQISWAKQHKDWWSDRLEDAKAEQERRNRKIKDFVAGDQFYSGPVKYVILRMGNQYLLFREYCCVAEEGRHFSKNEMLDYLNANGFTR